MLQRPKRLIGYLAHATDGYMGKMRDFLFDDRTGQVRHLVIGIAEQGKIRDVLLPLECVHFIHPQGQEIFVTLSRADILASPCIDTDPPVWWQKGGRWGFLLAGFPWFSAGGLQAELPVICVWPGKERGQDVAKGDPHLRSVEEVVTYAIKGVDGRAGFVRDFLMNTDKWVIQDIVVKTRRWLPGREVLVSWTKVQEVDYDKTEVRVGKTRNEVRNSPRYAPEVVGPITYGVG